MSSHVHAQVKPASSPAPSFTPAPSRLLQRKCACGGTAGLSGECAECHKEKLVGQNAPLIQPKLKISQPNDKYEQEADRVADEVMQMPEPLVQRQVGSEEEEEEEEMLQMKPLTAQITPLVQRETIDEEEDEEEEIALQRQPLTEEEEDEEELLQAKRADAQVPTVTSSVKAAAQSVQQGGGRPLDAGTRAFMEARFGYDFGNVRAHTDSRAARAAGAVNARAFTIESDVVFGEGEYKPCTNNGLRLLAHELTHVIQQRSSSSVMAPKSPMLQRSISFIDGDELDIFDPAVRIGDGEFYLGLTLEKLNGTVIKSEDDIEGSVRSPIFGGRRNPTDPRDGWECWIDSVPDNQGSFVISKLKAPPWKAKVPQSVLARLNVRGCEAVGILADVEVHGEPSNTELMDAVDRHESKHAVDHLLNFYDTFEVWDKRLTEFMKKKSRFGAEDKSKCERTFFTVIGGTPEDRGNDWLKRNTKSGNAFHNKADGKPARIVSAEVSSGCTRVKLGLKM